MAIQISIDGKCRAAYGTGRGIGHVVGALVVAAVDGVGRALVWVFDRIQSATGGRGRRRQMKLVESLALGNRRQLLLVVCDNRRYLVGVGADSVGGILAMEGSAESAESAGRVTSTRSRSIGRAAKGPELVKHRGRQMVSEYQAGSSVWP